MILTKCIKNPIEPSDGIRISVMSSHTIDGIIPDTEITENMYDIHIPELSAPNKLLGDYYKRGISWSEYETRYLEHIRTPYIQSIIINILSKYDIITFLCIESDDSMCHRRLLKEECNRLKRVTCL